MGQEPAYAGLCGPWRFERVHSRAQRRAWWYSRYTAITRLPFPRKRQLFEQKTTPGRHEREDENIHGFAVRKEYDDGQVDAAATAPECEADRAPATIMEKGADAATGASRHSTRAVAHRSTGQRNSGLAGRLRSERGK